ncbi:hypothetical protein T03_3288 [Trichinella britovi]|uniref:Uncharacterized protein n=1 Tax=Trichinella britovi TaxID=45882 RepID=A0A0V1CM26_TRIBR|nr:hypothetical protein T03_3288 [Trichinella britovi]
MEKLEVLLNDQIYQCRRNRRTQTLKQASITLTNTENNESNINNNLTMMRCNTLKCWSKRISQTNCTTVAVFSIYKLICKNLLKI